jgi:hypothetical protein
MVSALIESRLDRILTQCRTLIKWRRKGEPEQAVCPDARHVNGNDRTHCKHLEPLEVWERMEFSRTTYYVTPN